MPGSRVKNSKRRKKSPQLSSKSDTPPNEIEVSGAIYAVLRSALMYTKECRSLKGQADASPAVPKLLREVLSSVKKAEKRSRSLFHDTNIADLTNFLIGVYRQVNSKKITAEDATNLIDKAWAANWLWWSPLTNRSTTPIVEKMPSDPPSILYIKKTDMQQIPELGPAKWAYRRVGDMYRLSEKRVQDIVLSSPDRIRDWDGMNKLECLARFFVEILYRPPSLIVDHLTAVMDYSFDDPDGKSRLFARCQDSWSSINADCSKDSPETDVIHAAKSAPLVAPPKPMPNNARTSSWPSSTAPAQPAY